MNHTQKTEEITNKAVPFEVRRGWVGVPNAIYTVYSRHPDINWTDIAVYGYLLIHHNAKLGYAFPTQVRMAVDLGVSTDTIGRSIRSLKKADLIDVIKSSRYNGNQHFFKPVCETIEELVEKFPDIKDHVAKLDLQGAAIIAKGEEDKAKMAKAYRGENP